MKLIAKRILPLVLMAYIVTACLKGNDANFPTTAPTSGSILALIYNPNNGNTFNTGLEFFGQGAITFPATDESDTITFYATLQGPNTLGKDMTVSLQINNDALGDNFASDSIIYGVTPDSLYKILTPSAVIPAGGRDAMFQIIVYPSRISITNNYGLPITITDDGGVPVSSNHGTIYFHAIGNPIAGTYNAEWRRWNQATPTGAPNFDEKSVDDDIAPAVFAPINPNTINVSNPTGLIYIVTFKNTAGVLSNFKLAFPASGSGSPTAAGITISAQPTVVNADPSTGTYEFQFGYVNGSGAPRWIIDDFTK